MVTVSEYVKLKNLKISILTSYDLENVKLLWSETTRARMKPSGEVLYNHAKSQIWRYACVVILTQCEGLVEKK